MKDQSLILIVDDQNINRRILKRLLKHEYNIIEAQDGNEAWRIIQDQKIHLAAVLLDIVMPNMDGFEVLELIRKENLKDLPVIVMTSQADRESERKVLDAGAWDFVPKPFDAHILSTRLSNAIARSKVSFYEEIEKISHHDSLTGLYNRNKIFEETRKMIDRYPQYDYLFIRADIDHFALFNSSFGEKEGDKLLCYFADIIREIASRFEHIIYGRINADIFCACVAYDKTKPRQIDQIIADFQEKLVHYRQDYVNKISIGVYEIEDFSSEIEDYYMKSTLAVQKCKNQVGTNIGYYDQKITNELANELEITNEMQKALDDQQFVVYLQPKYYVSTETPAGAESLVRWNHPQKGLIPPSLFIPIFEKNGFVAKVDYFVWEKTCQLLKKWLDMGKKPNPISVNISRISLYNPQLVSLLVELVKKYKLDPKLLQLEVTESAIMSDLEQMQKTVHELRQAGFVILMDDFGSGYSSLNTLKTMEVDILKVDMKFLPNGEEMEKAEIILASVIRMANWIGMSVVVEGVETRRQRDFLEGTGCEYIQGYYYSKPIPHQEYEEKYVLKDEMIEKKDEIVKHKRHNVTILVIDDSAVDRAIIQAYFGDKYDIHQSESAEEALAYLRKYHNRVRLILVDNVMTGMSGIDFLKYCQSDPDLHPIPQIMITANDNTEDQIAVFEAGAYDYITKPLVKEVVWARVQHVMDISGQMQEYEKSEEDYRHRAEEDEATGVLNKSAFRKMCENELMKPHQEKKSLIIIDVDDFKSINDQYGHIIGDQVLKTVADELIKTFRNSDYIGRFGGDEFTVFMSSYMDFEIVKRKADLLMRAIRFACNEKFHFPISVSVGIAEYKAKDTFESIFARGDEALYEAKKNGKSKMIVYGEKIPPFRDDLPIVLVCGENPQLYPTIAIAYGNSASFLNVTSHKQLKERIDQYSDKICAICLEMDKKYKEKDSLEFYQTIHEYKENRIVPVLPVVDEGNMQALRDALELKPYDILTLPGQIDIIRRRLSNAISLGVLQSEGDA